MKIELPEKLTSEDIHEVGMNYRHDFGLTKYKEDIFGSGLTQKEREKLVQQIENIYESIYLVLVRKYKDEN